MRRFLKFIQSKIFITAVLVLIQLLVLFYFLISLTNNFVWYYVIGLILSVITVLDISSEPMNPSFKLTWIIAAMLFPLCGVPLYLIFAKSKQSYRIGKRFKSYKQMMRNAMRSTSDPLPEIEKDDPETARQMKYLQKYAYAPVYCNTETKYFPSGEEFYSDILRALTKAEKFIFMEYFIIEPERCLTEFWTYSRRKSPRE